MKRIPIQRGRSTNTRDRMAAILPHPAAHFAERARGSDRREIAAAGTRGWLYQRVTGGQVCTCGASDYVTQLDDGGNLTPEAMQQITTTVRASDRGLEVYNADDPDDEVESDPLPGNPQRPDIVDLPEIDLLGEEVNRCAVCFNSGFVPGFRLANGFRDALVPEDLVDGNYNVDQTQRPTEAYGGTIAEFQYTVPIRPVVFRVWDEDFRAHVVHPESGWTPGVQGPLRFHFEYRWTHIEIVSIDAGIPVDFNLTHYEDATETDYAEADFSIPGDYRVSLQSAIVEDRSNRVWQVRTVTPVKDNQGATVTQQVNARRVRTNELVALLMATGSRQTGAIPVGNSSVPSPAAPRPQTGGGGDWTGVGW